MTIKSKTDRRSLFRDTKPYREVNSEAQKEFSTDLRPPLLTWHMAFLVGSQSNSTLGAELDSKILALIRALRGDSSSTSVGGAGTTVEIFPKSKRRFILLSGIYSLDEIDKEDIKPLDESICAPRELYTLESQLKLVIITFRWHREGAGAINITIRIRTTVNVFSITVLAQMESSELQWTDFNSGMFHDTTQSFWEDRFVNNYILTLPGLEDLFEHKLFENIFADIRGVVISPAGLGATEDCVSWPENLIEQFRQAASCNDKHECSVNQMLDNRALLFTAFAPQPLDDDRASENGSLPDEPPREPLTFVLCVQSQVWGLVNRQQLGRTIDRMHLASTLRHAALLDITLLRTAGSQLSQIDDTFREARAAIENYDVHPDQSADAARRAIEKAHRQFNRITNDFLRKNTAHVGITFRIESSRNYHSQFEKSLPALGLKGIKGYHSYRDFVDRQLSAAFEYIDRLGTRYERATNALVEMDLRFSSIQARKTGDLLADIQRYGELLLLLILVPYYFLGILEHLFRKSGFWDLLFPDQREMLPIIIVLLSIIAFGGLRYVTGATQFEKLNNKSLFLAGWLFAILIALIFNNKGIVIEEKTVTTMLSLGLVVAYFRYYFLEHLPSYFEEDSPSQSAKYMNVFSFSLFSVFMIGLVFWSLFMHH